MAKYTSALGDKLCETTATSSIGLRHICKQLNVAYSTVTDWIYNPQHELHNKYIRAKQMQLHHLTEEILEIADDSTNDYMEVIRNGKKKIIQNREAITRSRLRIQARMNILTKLAPLWHRKEVEREHNVAEVFQPKSLTAAQQARMDAYITDSPPPKHQLNDPNSVAEISNSKTPASSPKKDLKPAPVKTPVKQQEEETKVPYHPSFSIQRHYRELQREKELAAAAQQ